MSADFDVRAKLTLDSQAAFGGAQRLSSSMQTLGHQLQGAQGLAGGLVGRVIGLGAAYFGLNAGINVFKSLIGGAVEYTSELQSTKIGLQSVLSAVTGASWEEAGKQGEAAFKRIQDAAVESPASARQMFDIFTGIVGPVMNTGASMEQVVSLTNDATMAAAGLHVDFAQASRDMSMMVRGAAGMDVKLFSLLRASNAIKETTEQWNKNLTAAQRVEKLAQALAKFKQAGDAYGKSWIGITSTLGDLKDRFKSAFMSPIMDMAARRLFAANQNMIKNQAQIVRLATIYGERVALGLEHAWERGVQGAQWLMSNWGNITRAIDHTMIRLHAMAPMLLKAAEIYAGVSVAGNVVGKGLNIGAGVIGAGGMAAGGMSRFLGLLGGGVGAAGAAGAAGAVEAAGAAGTAGAAETAVVGAATVAGETAAGETAAAGAAAAGAAVSIGAVAAGLVLMAATAEPVIDNWKGIKDAALTTTESVWGTLVDAGKSIWSGLRGPLYLIGGAFTVFGQLIGVTLVAGVNMAANAIRWFFDGIEPISSAIMEWAVPAMKALVWWIGDLARAMNAVTGNETVLQAADNSFKQNEWVASESTMAAILAGANTAQAVESKRQKDLAKQTTKVTNDFRGSNIKIDQKFEGDQDPDRIVVGMMSDLTRQAELRLSSGYAGVFTR